MDLNWLQSGLGCSGQVFSSCLLRSSIFLTLYWLRPGDHRAGCRRKLIILYILFLAALGSSDVCDVFDGQGLYLCGQVPSVDRCSAASFCGLLDVLPRFRGDVRGQHLAGITRTKLISSRRRISYLLVGVVFLAIGDLIRTCILGLPSPRVPDILYFSGCLWKCRHIFVFADHGLRCCFFGVSWPDRVVRSRLMKWLLRCPITVFIMLLLLTVTVQVSDYFGDRYTVAVPIISVISVMLSEHLITLVYPYLERSLFDQGEDEGFYLIQNLSERLVSLKDLRQFLDAIMAAVCDQFQVSTGFVSANSDTGWEIVFHVGEWETLKI